MQLTDDLCHLLLTKPTEADTGKARYREIGTWIGNLLDIMREANPSGLLEEKVFQWINGNELLVRTVSSVKVPQYIYLADIIAGNTEEMLFSDVQG